jgi:hypothetical protein
MATNTYVALDKKTIAGSSTTSITFSSISSAYTDLRVVINGAIGGGSPNTFVRVGNGTVDTGSNYSATYVQGTSSVTNSGRFTGASSMQVDYYGSMSTTNSTHTLDFMNYSNTTTNKSVITRFGNTTDAIYDGTGFSVGLWRSTVAIDTITIFVVTSNFSAGTTFSLYGIKAEGVTPAPKATGGAIYSDDTYYYHAFGATGAFVPSQALTADILTIAGGGSGGLQYAGGGGAGGLVFSSSASLVSGTSYTCTVGAGAAKAVDSGTRDGSAGSNSSFAGSGFSTITANGGGLGGGDNGNVSRAGGGGGSGGGGTAIGPGAGGTGSQGFNGGAGGGTSTYGGGGGGSGEAGNTDGNGFGGDGTSTYSSWGLATGIGEFSAGTYYIAGGGGGSSSSAVVPAGGLGGGGNGGYISGGAIAPTAGRENTGSGGGAGWGGNNDGGKGGSGVVIVRYLKA